MKVLSTTFAQWHICLSLLLIQGKYFVLAYIRVLSSAELSAVAGLTMKLTDEI